MQKLVLHAHHRRSYPPPDTFDDAVQDIDVIIRVASVSSLTWLEPLRVLAADAGFLACP